MSKEEATAKHRAVQAGSRLRAIARVTARLKAQKVKLPTGFPAPGAPCEYGTWGNEEWVALACKLVRSRAEMKHVWTGAHNRTKRGENGAPVPRGVFRTPRHKGPKLPPASEVRELVAQGPWKKRKEMRESVEGRRAERLASILRIPISPLLRSRGGYTYRDSREKLSGDALRGAIAKGPWKTRAQMLKSPEGRRLERMATAQRMPISPILSAIHGSQKATRKWTEEKVVKAIVAGGWRTRKEMDLTVEGKRVRRAAEVLRMRLVHVLATIGQSEAVQPPQEETPIDADEDAPLPVRRGRARGEAKNLPANCWLFGGMV